MQNWLAEGSASFRGTVRVPGDKSISHRALMLGAIAQGKTEVRGFLDGADCLATLSAFRNMGVQIERSGQDVMIHGVGLRGLTAPTEALDLGNSGTSMRLLAGLLAGQAFNSVLIGDASLQQRPMRRVSEPLALMGARIETEANGTAPLRIYGSALNGIDYRLPVASAQIKSALLLAALYAQGITRIEEPQPSRDHSERMLSAFGVNVTRQGSCLILEGGQALQACDLNIPSDVSSAAFLMVAALITPGAALTIRDVGINPTRAAVIEILQAMGGKIHLFNQRHYGAEPVADIEISASNLRGIDIRPEWVPIAIDEFPIIFIAAACAEGVTVARDLHELRVKESDRLGNMARHLSALGVAVNLEHNDITITGRATGSAFSGGVIDSHGDHRLAMSFAVASQRAAAPIRILDCDNVATSFPHFMDLMQDLGMRLAVHDA